jgi:Domain of Unknown Function (DUF1080)
MGRHHRLVAMVALVGLFIAGCGPYTVTSQPTAAPAPTRSPSSTPGACIGSTVPTSLYAPPPDAMLALCDSLSTSGSPASQGDVYGWDYYAPNQNHDGICQMGLQGCAVQVPANSPDMAIDCRANNADEDFSNFAFAIRMKISQAMTHDSTFGVGIEFRCTNTLDVCYEYTFDARGEYSLCANRSGNVVHNGALPITNQNTSYFNTSPGSTNQLAVLAVKGSIRLFVNGHQIVSVTDSTSGSGQIGVALDAPSEGTAEAFFTDAEVWKV